MTNFEYLAGGIPFRVAYQGRCEYLSINELLARNISVCEEDLQRFPDHEVKVAVYQTGDDCDSVYIAAPPWESAPWEFYFAGKYFVQLNWKFSDERAVFLLAYLAKYLRYAPVVEMWYIWVDNEYPMPPPKILTYAYSDMTVDLMQELTLFRGRGIYCIRIVGENTGSQIAPWVVSPRPAAEPLCLPLMYTSRNEEHFPAHIFSSLSSWPHPRRFDYYILHEDILPDRPDPSGICEFFAGSMPFAEVVNPHVTRLSLREYMEMYPETRDGFSLFTTDRDAPVVMGCEREELLGELSVSPQDPDSFTATFTALPHAAVVSLNYTVPRAEALCSYIVAYLANADAVELWSVYCGHTESPPEITECRCSDLTPELLADAAGYFHTGVRCLRVRRDSLPCIHIVSAAISWE